MITWRVGNSEIEGFDKDGAMIYYTINFPWQHIECSVWSEQNPWDANRFVAIFREKKGTRKSPNL